MRAASLRLSRRLGTGVTVAAGAAALWLVSGVGFANYDTLYALAWGGQLARGELPAYDIAIAPTPHPLIEALGVVLYPLGPRAVDDVTVALGFLALSACGWAVYRLGSLWFGRAAGAVAALILLTRVPILSYGVRAYVDVPYLLLVLSALLVESRRRALGEPPAGAPVLALLALAGLLRPEAWVFSGLYLIYLMGWMPSALRERLRARPQLDAVAAPPGAGATRRPPGVETTSSASPGSASPGSASQGNASQGSASPGGASQGGAATWPRPSRRRLLGLALLAAAGPLVWTSSDLAITGDALWSLTNTRHTAHALARITGIANVPEYVPRRIGEILRPPVLAGAALGGVLSLLWLRRRALTGAVAGVLAVGVFVAVAAAGLPINTRYAFLTSAILCVFCGAGALGWTRLPRDDPRRRWWMAGGALVLVALLAYAPSQYRGAHRELDKLARQQSIEDDLLALVEDHSITLDCGAVGVPNHAPVPLLALYLRTSPREIVSAQVGRVSSGVYVDPASKQVEDDYVLDPHDPHLPVSVPPGFTEAHANRSWLIFQRCS